MYYHYFQMNIYKKGVQNPRVIRFCIHKNELISNGARKKWMNYMRQQMLAYQRKELPGSKKPSISFQQTRRISGKKPDFPVLKRAKTARLGNILSMRAMQGAHWVIFSYFPSNSLGPLGPWDFFIENCNKYFFMYKYTCETHTISLQGAYS